MTDGGGGVAHLNGRARSQSIASWILDCLGFGVVGGRVGIEVFLQLRIYLVGLGWVIR